MAGAVARRGSESEHVRYSPGEIVLGRGGVDLDGGQPRPRRLFAQHVREHPVAFEQVAQGPSRVSGPGEKYPRPFAPTLDHRLADLLRSDPGFQADHALAAVVFPSR